MRNALLAAWLLVPSFFWVTLAASLSRMADLGWWLYRHGDDGTSRALNRFQAVHERQKAALDAAKAATE